MILLLALLALCALIFGYGPAADAVVRRKYRSERDEEIRIQTEIIDAHWRRIERRHGVAGRKRAVELAMLQMEYILPPELEEELAYLINPEPAQEDDKRAAE